MIPLSDIMDDIKILTRAVAIRLPESLKELEHMLSKKRGREEADQVGSQEASSVPDTHKDTHGNASQKKGRSVTTVMNGYSPKLDSDMPSRYPGVIEEYNALQNKPRWRTSTNPFERDDHGHDNTEQRDEFAQGDGDDAEEEYDDDDNLSDVGHRAPETKIEPWWTSEEDRRLKKMRSDKVSWGRIMEEFPNRAERKVKEHWFKDLYDGARGEKPSSTSMRAKRSR